jgi:hypothetical protein
MKRYVLTATTSDELSSQVDAFNELDEVVAYVQEDIDLTVEMINAD